VDPRNCVLDGGPDPAYEGAILRAKRGWHRAYPDMSAGRHTQSDSAGGRTGRAVVDGNAHWRHLANTTEPSMYCDDVALCQIILTTCFSH